MLFTEETVTVVEEDIEFGSTEYIQAKINNDIDYFVTAFDKDLEESMDTWQDLCMSNVKELMKKEMERKLTDLNAAFYVVRNYSKFNQDQIDAAVDIIASYKKEVSL
jgi:hypothetical protein